jgi:hypothetical protein
MILAALLAGASAGATEVVSQAIKDGYEKLKDLVKRRFEGHPEAEMALAKVESKPEVWKEPLADAIRELKLDQDAEVVQAATQFQTLIQGDQNIGPKYQVHLENNQGVIVGDHANMTLNLGEQKKKTTK